MRLGGDKVTNTGFTFPVGKAVKTRSPLTRVMRVGMELLKTNFVAMVEYVYLIGEHSVDRRLAGAPQ